MKPYSLMLSVILLMFFSCKKTDYTSQTNGQQSISVAVPTVITSSILPLSDTIPPTNAVSVKKYGAIGDGIHDDTNALQSAINLESILILAQGTYIINNTLNLRTGVKIYGTNGAIIKAGTSMHGTLLSLGRYILINNADDCLITNIRFQQSGQPFNLVDWGSACIYIGNGKRTNIAYNNFDFNLPYSANGLKGVWVSGAASANNVIANNKFTDVGIEYAENGSNTTIVDGNYIKHAPSDAISAHGNSTSQTCLNNIVNNNIIENAGYMGIEDWGNITGTAISNNTITGTGKDPVQQLQGMGISAVGVNAKITNNKITDSQLYYIESGASNYIDGNVINDMQDTAIGIIVNFTTVASGNTTYNASLVLNNTITGCKRSIVIFGDYLTNTSITSNTIINPVFIGINIDSASPAYTANVTDNKISFSIPNVQIRKGFESYSSLKHGTGNQNLTLNNNTITYATTANGGTGLEYGLEIGTDNTIINANKIYANSIQAGKSQVYAITGNSNPAYAITLTNNMVYNALVSLKDFIIKTKSANNFN